MKSHADRTILVYDHGHYVEWAITLAKDFGRVLYYVPWEFGFPRSNTLRIGEGIKEIDRVTSPWPHYDDIDLWVFPDVYEGPLQKWLVEQGKRVWGCRLGEEMEIDRARSKQLAKQLGIEVGPYKVITGIDALRDYLQNNDDQWVKVSATRGDMETFHSKNYQLSETRVDELEHTLGAQKKQMEFIVEASIKPAIEVGYDGYTIDGKFAKNAFVGVEAKNDAYLGRVLAYKDVPTQVREVNEKLAPALKRYGYRGLISTEVRTTPDGKAYLIDPCCRMGSPPGEVMQMLITNWGDILWEGANGIVIEPEFAAKWGAEILLDSDWADANWQQVTFPKSVRAHVKLHNMAVIEGEYYVIPQWRGSSQIGAVVAIGDSADEAIDSCRRIAEKVEGYSIDKPIASLDKAREQLAKILGPKMDDKPPSKLERQARELYRAGHISDRQLAKITGQPA